MAAEAIPSLAFGFWWIRAKPNTPASIAITTEWQVAEYTANGWYVCGDERCWKDHPRNRAQIEIGYRTSPP